VGTRTEVFETLEIPWTEKLKDEEVLSEDERETENIMANNRGNVENMDRTCNAKQ